MQIRDFKYISRLCVCTCVIRIISENYAVTFWCIRCMRVCWWVKICACVLPKTASTCLGCVRGTCLWLCMLCSAGQTNHLKASGKKWKSWRVLTSPSDWGSKVQRLKSFLRNKAIYYTIIRERLACEWGCTSTFSFCIYSYCHFRRVWQKLWKRKVLNGKECQYPCVELSALKRGFGERTGQYIKIKYQSIKRIHKDCRLQGYVRQTTLCLTLNFSLHICGRFNRPLRPPPVMEESPGLCSLEYHFAAWWWLFYGQSLWGNLISITFKKRKKNHCCRSPMRKETPQSRLSVSRSISLSLSKCLDLCQIGCSNFRLPQVRFSFRISD